MVHLSRPGKDKGTPILYLFPAVNRYKGWLA